ncbi:MAG: arginine repressor [Ruminococcaceae bacterium]|nr:arginine repressor [Oscillospiraceae bacterium]
MKNARQDKIVELISENVVETQEELSELLKKSGFRVTQATVSRDIRELKLVKTPTHGSKSRYSIGREKSDANAHIQRNLLVTTVTKVDFASNITVVKTIPGMAQGAAAAIDAMHFDGIVGCVAGDDTIIIVMRSEQSAESLKEDIENLK